MTRTTSLARALLGIGMLALLLAPEVAARNIRVSGCLVYNGVVADSMPADAIRVRVYDSDTNPDDKLAVAIADSRGCFDVNVDTDDAGEKNPDLYVEFETKNGAVVVESDWWEVNFKWKTDTRDNFKGSHLNIGTVRALGDETEALQIHTDITRAWRWLIDYQGYQVPQVEVQYAGMADYYDARFEEIHIEDDSGWDESTHVHEYGHHWVNMFGDFEEDLGLPGGDGSYDNEYCDDGFGWGHCAWCEESPVVAWQEGFPDWFSDKIVDEIERIYSYTADENDDFEDIGACQWWHDGAWRSCDCDPVETEGFLAAVLHDIEDLDQDDHTAGDGVQDALALGASQIFTVANYDEPRKPRGFLTQFKNRYPGVKEDLWETAKNVGYEIDENAPANPAPGLMGSSSHAKSVASPRAQITFTWARPDDDASGIGGYSIGVGNTTAEPDTTQEIDDIVQYQTPVLSPGSHYLSIRSIDRAGRWASGYSWYGPIYIGLPDFNEFAISSHPGDGRHVQRMDFDGDGDLDVYAVHSDGTNQLLRNDGGQVFSDASNSVLRGSAGYNRGATWGDYDGDGDLDVYLLREWRPNRLLRNDGGTFVSAFVGLVEDSGPGSAAAWTDCDNDGDLDLYLGNRNADDRLFRNEGDGRFTDLSDTAFTRVDRGQVIANAVAHDPDPGYASALALGDYDGDGDIDLYLVKGDPYGGQAGDHANVLFENTGQCSFRDVAIKSFKGDAAYHSPALPPLVSSSFLSSPGAALGAALEGASAGAPEPEPALLGDPGHGSGSAWGDYDNDGDLDLYLVNYDGPNALFVNDPGCAGIDHPHVRFCPLNSHVLAEAGEGPQVEWVDFDADGDLDLFVGAQSGSEKRSKLLRNDGGAFVDATDLLWPLELLPSATWADFDGDGNLDVAGATTLLVNELPGLGNWVEVELVATETASASGARMRVLAGSLQQYGYVGSSSLGEPLRFGLGLETQVDLIEVTWPSGIVEVFVDQPIGQTLQLSEGTGAFSWEEVSGGFGAASDRGAWGDFDGDGDPDRFVAGFTRSFSTIGGSNQLLRNDGGGLFTEVTPVAIATPDSAENYDGTAAGSWADMDDDGDLDLLLVQLAEDHVFVNDGSGGFAEATGAFLDPEVDCDFAARFGDYDGDGDLDLACGRGLYDNEGGLLSPSEASFCIPQDWGGFVCGTGEQPFHHLVDVVGWPDLDDDGDPDLVLVPFNKAPEVWRNDGLDPFGSWRFTRVVLPISPERLLVDVAWGDHDADGDLDLFAVDRVLRNEGGMGFSQWVDWLPQLVRESPHPAWGDFDADGDLDIFISHEDRNELLRNQGAGTFRDATPALLVNAGHAAASWVDFDGDGDLDLQLGAKLFRNDLQTGAHWLQVDLEGVRSNEFGVGARVRISAGGRTQRRQVTNGDGPLTVSFGLGAADQVDVLEVLWPSGLLTSEVFLTADARVLAEERLRIVSVENASLNESEAGVSTLDFTLQLDSPSDGNVAISYATVGDTAAEGSDYIGVSGTVSIPLGQSTAVVSVPVVDDALAEASETFVLELGNPYNLMIALGDEQVTGKILDDDGTAARVTIHDAETVELDDGSAELHFRVTLSQPVPEQVWVPYTVEGRTATAGEDFVRQSGVLYFEPNEVENFIVVEVRADARGEFDEDLRVRLDDASNALVSSFDDFGVGTIVDDDAFPSALSREPASVVPWDQSGSAPALGYSIADAGDVNDDGFDDVIVGGPWGSRAELYLGSADGLEATPVWVQVEEDACELCGPSLFGHVVAGAGDVDGDGYDDVLVGAPLYTRDLATLLAEGAAFVYRGGPSGPSTTADWVAYGGEANIFFGWSAAGAGDVDADGSDDILVGAMYGKSAHLWLGSVGGGLGPDAVAADADWSVDDPASLHYFSLGMALAGAGDVNGDGHDDVMIGSTPDGHALVWYGGETGPDAGASTLGPGGEWSTSGFDAQLAGPGLAERVRAVASAGDVNADGFADVVLGTGERALLYLGSASGLAADPAWNVEGPARRDFGYSISPAGDVNADGYDDVLVGHRELEGYGLRRDWGIGRAILYLGTSSGLATAPVWFVDDAADERVFAVSGAELGNTMVAGGGDVNDDGHADLLVGSPEYRPDHSGPGGGFFVYHGGETTWPGTPAAVLEGGGRYGNLGASAASGDFDDDGFGDLVLGAPGYNSSAGAAFAYRGSSEGVEERPSWSIERDTFGYLGSTAASAGDVNGDGYDDFLVGAPAADQFGSVALHLGSPDGLEDVAAWTAVGEQRGSYFGRGLAGVGDVNGDGYDDVVVGAPDFSMEGHAGVLYEGKAYLYLGSSTGLSPTPTWSFVGEQAYFSHLGPEHGGFGAAVASAGDVNTGDVNDDGYADVAIGHPLYDITKAPGEQGTFGGGRVYVFLGSASGLSSASDWIAENDIAAGRRMGSSVAWADFDGDGYADLLAGDPMESRVVAWLGAEDFVSRLTGTPANADWILQRPGKRFGYKVAAVGDLNADGREDVAIADTVDDTFQVHPGTGAGPTLAPVWSGPFLRSVAAAGDLDGDGWDDLVADDSVYYGAPQIGLRLHPFVPSDAEQYQWDGVTRLILRSTTIHPTVVLTATVEHVLGGDLQLEVELRRAYELPFTGEPTDVSESVPSGEVASVQVGSLFDGIHHWRYRARHASGLTSPWVEFSGEGHDFNIDNRQWPVVQITSHPGSYVEPFWDVLQVHGDVSGEVDVVAIMWRTSRGETGVAELTPGISAFDWRARVPLHGGSNTITVEAIDAVGHRGEVDLWVTRERDTNAFLSLSVGGAGSGRVLVEPVGQECDDFCNYDFYMDPLHLPDPVVLTLTPLPDDYSVFAGWAGPGCDDVVTLTSRKQTVSCYASFEPETTYGAVQTAWTDRYDDARVAVGVAFGSEGSVYVAGRYIVSTDPSVFEFVVRKLDAAGGVDWETRWAEDTPGTHYVYDMAVDPAGNVYVAGVSSVSDLVVVKFDTEGVEQWVGRHTPAEASYARPNDLAVDAAGNAYVVASSSGEYGTIKFDSSGSEDWFVPWNEPTGVSAIIKALALDSAGNVYVTGTHDEDWVTIAYDASGGELWRDRYDGPSGLVEEVVAIAVGPDDHPVVTGQSEDDYATLKYGPGGTRLWIARYEATAPRSNSICWNYDWDCGNLPTGVAIGSDGSVVVTGSSTGLPGGTLASDYATVKYDAEGNERWVARYDGPLHGVDVALDVAVDASGRVAVTGFSERSGSREDYVTIQYDANGELLWFQYLDGQGWPDEPVAVAADAAFGVVVTGAGAFTGVGGAFLTVRYVGFETDVDGDGWLDRADNCPTGPNEGQTDQDGDGLGDLCDPDADDDGLLVGDDNCPLHPNPEQADQDGDDIGDLCDSDLDGDAVADVVDNCEGLANSNQNDLDADGFGDACDSDADGDGIADVEDECPLAAGNSQIQRGCPDDDEDPDGDGYVNQIERSTGSNEYSGFSVPLASTLRLNPGFNLVGFPAESYVYRHMRGLLEVLGGDAVIHKVLVPDAELQEFAELYYDSGGDLVGPVLEFGPGLQLAGMVVYADQPLVYEMTSSFCGPWVLRAGVNVVHAPCMQTARSAHQLLADLGGTGVVASIQRFDSETGRFETAAFFEGAPVGPDFPILASEAYLLHMRQDLLGFYP